MTLRLERIGPLDVPWKALDGRPDRSVFRTRSWLEFLHRTQRAEAALARVLDGTTTVGWFTGAVVKRAGLRVLGSPLPGWTTSYMGFDLDDPGRTAEAVTALRSWAFGPLGCVHVEVMDRALDAASVPAGFRSGALAGYERDLRVDDDRLLGTMTAHGRRDVRRALRNGIVVEEVAPEGHRDLVDEYYAQVADAFAKRGRRPTYPPDRVVAALSHLEPERVLVLRARTPEGEPAASGIFPGLPGSTAVFWMGAGDRDRQHLLPNEALMWHALRAWRDRGAVRFDFGGGGTYKAKYGGTPIGVPWLRASRFRSLESVREALRRRSRRSGPPVAPGGRPGRSAR